VLASRCSGHGEDKRPLDDTDVEEALSYLAEFDIVTRIENMQQLLEQSAKRTGWNNKLMDNKVHSNKSVLKYNITNEMEQQMLSNVGLQMDLKLWERAHELGLFTG